MKTNVDKFMMLDNSEIVRVTHSGYIQGRKWTCVKFADGRIEWVETSRLKKNIHTRAIEFIMSMGFSWTAAVNWYTILFFFGLAIITGTLAHLMYLCYTTCF